MAVTFTLKAHEPLAAMLAPEKVINCEPVTALIVPFPQVPVSPAGVATTRPDGNESSKATPFNASEELGLVMVNESVVEALSPIDAAPNVSTRTGAAPTVRLAVAMLPAPPLVEVTTPVVFV
jgi:hypothetical protein